MWMTLWDSQTESNWVPINLFKKTVILISVIFVSGDIISMILCLVEGNDNLIEEARIEKVEVILLDRNLFHLAIRKTRDDGCGRGFSRT